MPNRVAVVTPESLGSVPPQNHGVAGRHVGQELAEQLALAGVATIEPDRRRPARGGEIARVMVVASATFGPRTHDEPLLALGPVCFVEILVRLDRRRQLQRREILKNRQVRCRAR